MSLNQQSQQLQQMEITTSSQDQRSPKNTFQANTQKGTEKSLKADQTQKVEVKQALKPTQFTMNEGKPRECVLPKSLRSPRTKRLPHSKIDDKQVHHIDLTSTIFLDQTQNSQVFQPQYNLGLQNKSLQLFDQPFSPQSKKITSRYRKQSGRVNILLQSADNSMTPHRIIASGERSFGESSDRDKIGSKEYKDLFLENETSEKIISTPRESSLLIQRSNPNFELPGVKHQKVEVNAKLFRREFTQEEVKENHLAKVAKIVDPYFLDKQTFGNIVQGSKSNESRVIRHTYQTYKKQNQIFSPEMPKRPFQTIVTSHEEDYDSMHPTDPRQRQLAEEKFKQKMALNQVGRIVAPLSQVRVPKDLILMKIAQKEVELHRDEFKRDKSNDYVEKSIFSEISRPNQLRQLAFSRDDPLQKVNSSYSSPKKLGYEPYIEDTPLQTAIPTVNDSLESHQKLVYEYNQKQKQIQSIDQLSFKSPAGFHITDLLKSSTSKGTEKMQATIDYYKRSLKSDDEMNSQKIIVIKNYRLRVVDAEKDFTAADRQLMHTNKGTNIYVANSLIKPEVFKYSTKVTGSVNDLLSQKEMTLNPKDYRKSFMFKEEIQLGQLKHEQESRRQLIESRVTPIGINALIDSPNLIDQQNDFKVEEQEDAQNGENCDGKNEIELQTFEENQNSQANFTEDLTQEEFNAYLINMQMNEQWINPFETLDRLKQKRLSENQRLQDARYRLINGQFAPLSAKEIATRMLKQDQFDILIEPTCIQNNKPYLHLQRTVVNQDIKRINQEFLKETVMFNDTRTNLKPGENPLVQVMDLKHLIQGINFVKQEYTHLDPHLIQPNNLLADIYLEEDHIKQVVKKLENRKEGEEILGKTDFYMIQGKDIKPSVIEVEIVSFNPETRLFTCINNQLGIMTTRNRQNLLFKGDAPNFISSMRKSVVMQKAETQQYLRLARLIQTEMCKRFNNHALPENMRLNIIRKTGDLSLFDKAQVEKTIVQVEAQFVFAVMKACLSSQRYDPLIKNMLINFNVSLDSPAIEIEKQNHKEKKDLHPGILAFKGQAIKNELESHSLFIRNQKYMNLPKFLMKLSLKFFSQHEILIFQTPLPTLLIGNIMEKKFKNLDFGELNEMLNEYPLKHSEWINAQKIVTKHFNRLMRKEWADLVSNKVWDYIQDDFEFDIQKVTSEDKIDPNLLKLFYQIKQFQTSRLDALFTQGCRKFLFFLLSFALRSSQIKKSKIINTIAKQNSFQLVNHDQSFVQKREKTPNNLDLIPIELHPFIYVGTKVVIEGQKRRQKFTIVTEPDLQTLQRDMMQVVKNMYDSLQNLKRVETIIFPNLKLDDYFITRPDLKSQKHRYILKLIEKLLEQSNQPCQNQVLEFQKYCSILNIKVDKVIRDLRAQSFALANENEKSSQVSNSQLSFSQKVTELMQNENYIRESTPLQLELSDDSQSEVEQEQYLDQQIDDTVLCQFLTEIRDHRYNVLNYIWNSYDYGLLHLDCIPIKQSIVNHCLTLEQKVSDHFQQDFQNQMNQVNKSIEVLTGCLKKEAQSIEEVISWLDYIDQLTNQKDQVSAIGETISQMSTRLDFMDSLKVMLPIQMRLDFWNMRNWPRLFEHWIQTKKTQLSQQKEQLIKEQALDAETVFKQVQEYRDELTQLLTTGLVNLSTEQQKQRSNEIKSLFHQLSPEAGVNSNSIKVAPFIVFDWLCIETKNKKESFDVKTVEQTVEMVTDLLNRVQEMKLRTAQINQNESLLGVEQTKFTLYETLLQEATYLDQLWQIARQFTNQVALWFEAPIDQLEFNQIETTADDWKFILDQIKIQPIISDNQKQKELLKFILECLLQIRKYFELIRVTRVRGMKGRHWREICTLLKITVDPKRTCLLKLIGMRLYEENSYKIIKAVSDQAYQDYMNKKQED